MANITLSAPAFFQNGVGGVSSVIGYADKANRVARYSFVAPSTGASGVNLSIAGLVYGDGTRPTSFRFYIGTSATSHINAGASSEHTGILNIGADKTSFSESASVLLLPNTTYYLFVFPNTTEYGWFTMELATVALEGTGGSYSVPTLSASAIKLGFDLTINTNRYSTGFTHTITYTFGGVSGTIATGVTDSCIWTPSFDLARQIPNATAGVATIYCATYNGAAQVGSTQSVQVTLQVSDWMLPTASMEWADTSDAFDSVAAYVQNVSKLAVTVTGTGTYGSTITGASVTLDGVLYTGAVITKAGEHTLVATVADSRGRKGTATKTLTVAAYAAPQLTLDASRCTEDGTADDIGEYCKVTITGSTTQVNGQNTAALSFTYGSTTKSVAVDVGSFTHSEIVQAQSTATLALSATLSDKLLTATRSTTLPVGYATMDFLKGGKGIAFGATATREGFECAMPAYFNGILQGNAAAKYISTSGDNVLWLAGEKCLGNVSSAGLVLVVNQDAPANYALCYYHLVFAKSCEVKTLAGSGITYSQNIYGTLMVRDNGGNSLSNVGFAVLPYFAL